MGEDEVSVRQGMGREQRKWLSRIRSAGGEVTVTIVPTPIVKVPVLGGRAVRMPIRMLESLLERDLFEKVNEHQGFTRYRLVEDAEGDS